MPRFFTSPENIRDEKITLFPDDIRHIIHVLRMKAGEHLTVCDTKGFDYSCEIAGISDKDIALKIISKNKTTSEPEVNVILYQGLPKQEKMEFIIQKSVELGISKIVPVETERAIVKLRDKEDKKVARWQKISEAAAKQSCRGIIPFIENPISFKDAVLSSLATDLSLIPYELEEKKGIKPYMEGFKGKSISIFIGPEGGFTEAEIKFASVNKIMPVTLGKRILRTETAGLVALSLIMYELGEL